MRTGQAWTLGSTVLVFAAQAPTMGAMRLQATPTPSHGVMRSLKAPQQGPQAFGAETGHPHWLFPKRLLFHASKFGVVRYTATGQRLAALTHPKH